MSILPSDSSSSAIDSTITTTDLPIYRDYAWDFDNDDYIIQDAELVIIEEDEALKVWIYKALKTPRFRYLAYSLYYGNEFETLISQNYDSDIVNIELKALIEQCLLVNPYIKSIDTVNIEFDDAKLTGTIYLTTIYGSIEQEVNVDV
ncbi:DUF2634 domain-containing protein [Clostridium saccharobutylicum]|uniref:Phage-like element pbsx protein XkdS n=1 Tax=Clostridium saccharobutylicum DSM 13864 TaxID=1345695 RepID=U5MWF1_CLOSA|nr:DUF2634 domain-containing protein [Clostridium saccharobutylicum]AGX43946.1 phage-like element pbsx protein XkdS [Clostridium saccharobutylicum DSM 13864]AQR91244.1 hypothetical protein CLOSC_29680 [Clostridium saccharobutylicum]AQS01148.1 hypothetical protein CSACC_29750 [Clostridium saccharobutylicum]AQS10561.1 hypothetical protein CLOBY_27060 [Clostridium saccharobutylicum]AQS15131.1 hypothetical protein CLOSACC_29750 [Clostridium saccharobutylicum]